MTRIILAGLALAIGVAHAQDRRQVAQPAIPAVCSALAADKFVGTDRVVADADEHKPDTALIQAALDRCAPGQAVQLATAQGRNAFLSGPLRLPDGVTLLIEKGVTLYASRNPADYDYPSAPSVCASTDTANRRFGTQEAAPEGLRTNKGPAAPIGCQALITIANAKNAAVMGGGIIDGRGDMQLTGRDYSWWQMARKAEPGNKKYYSVRLIVARHADGLVLYGIALHNSPNYHVTVNDTDGFTAWDVHLQTPTVAHTDARNTDGIDPGNSTNITVAHSWIDNEDDNIAIKTGVTHMSVLHNHFYRGHGMSIGSETYSGDSHLLVDDLVEDHTTSGIRIKSNVTRGGLVHDLLYQNICMRDVQMPIAISPYYNNGTVDQFDDPGFKGTRIPHYQAITLRNVTVMTAGDVLIAGADERHRTEVRLENVHIAGIKPDQVHMKLADIANAGTNIPMGSLAQDVKVRALGMPVSATPYSCAGKFVPMR
ncbi:MAG: glycosyl hydrolase family 28 protein [Pseudomonadota bacterium]